jgi:hypothetical protein
MPHPVPTPTGACVADVESDDGLRSLPVRVHDWVDAKPCPVRPVDIDVAQLLGQDLAKTHALRRTGLPQVPRTPSPKLTPTSPLGH